DRVPAPGGEGPLGPRGRTWSPGTTSALSWISSCTNQKICATLTAVLSTARNAKDPREATGKKGETREAILDATDRLLATRGFRKLTMDDIAAEAGVSRRTIYMYFP